MGRGTSKAGGASGNSAKASQAENAIYELPKNATRKAITEMLANAPIGTTFAYTTQKGSTFVYEKSAKNPLYPQGVWDKTEMDEVGGVTLGYGSEDIITDIKNFILPKDSKKGLTSEQRKKYKKNYKELKKSRGW